MLVRSLRPFVVVVFRLGAEIRGHLNRVLKLLLLFGGRVRKRIEASLAQFDNTFCEHEITGKVANVIVLQGCYGSP